jgi:hypothetical protein
VSNEPWTPTIIGITSTLGTTAVPGQCSRWAPQGSSTGGARVNAEHHMLQTVPKWSLPVRGARELGIVKFGSNKPKRARSCDRELQCIADKGATEQSTVGPRGRCFRVVAGTRAPPMSPKRV